MTHQRRTHATRTWTLSERIELPGEFNAPVYFKVLKTKAVGSVAIELSRGDKRKKLTLHAVDPALAMVTLVEKAKAWDEQLSSA
jgi:hypothetical protein